MTPLNPRLQRKIARGDAFACSRCHKAKTRAQFGTTAYDRRRSRCLTCEAAISVGKQDRQLKRELKAAEEWSDPEAAVSIPCRRVVRVDE